MIQTSGFSSDKNAGGGRLAFSITVSPLWRAGTGLVENNNLLMPVVPEIPGTKRPKRVMTSLWWLTDAALEIALPGGSQPRSTLSMRGSPYIQPVRPFTVLLNRCIPIRSRVRIGQSRVPLPFDRPTHLAFSKLFEYHSARQINPTNLVWREGSDKSY